MTARTIIHVPIGEMRVSATPDNILYTCVGSCCAVALYDAENKIAGLVHTVLPGTRDTLRAGDRNAFLTDAGILLLISEMEQQGAVCAQMTAIIVGGACLAADGNSNIGSRNVEKALFFLKKAEIPVTRKETGGELGRVIEIAVNNGCLKIRQTPVNKLQMPEESVDNFLSESDLNSISRNISRLQASPKAARELFDVIHEINIDWQQVEIIFFQDIVLALHVFQMCNSDYYGVPGQIDSFDTALSRLGPDRFRRICVVAAAGRNNDTLLANKGLDQKALSRHCLASAICAQHIAKKTSPNMQRQASIVQPPMEHGKMTLAAIVHTSCCISSMLGVTAAKEMVNSDFSLYVLEQTKIVHVDDRFLSKIIKILRSKELLPH